MYMFEQIGALGGGIVGTVIGAILFMASIMYIFLPFYVAKINSNIIKANDKRDQIIQNQNRIITLLGGQAPATKFMSGKEMKVCRYCNTNNRVEDTECINCKRPLPDVSV